MKYQLKNAAPVLAENAGEYYVNKRINERINR